MPYQLMELKNRSRDSDQVPCKGVTELACLMGIPDPYPIVSV